MKKAGEKLYQILKRHVPDNAVHYCYDLWAAHPFHFRVTRSRNTKLGDYRYDRRNGDHIITINHDLNIYSFLITYIHEVAHQYVQIRYGKRMKPHGDEWRQAFIDLMQPLLNDLIFPVEVLKPLRKYMLRPGASTTSNAPLYSALRRYDGTDDGLEPLSSVENGDIFEFNNRMFERLYLRRTRVVCRELTSSRKYLIPQTAFVRLLRQNTKKKAS